jgi:carbonic anhydrase
MLPQRGNTTVRPALLCDEFKHCIGAIGRSVAARSLRERVASLFNPWEIAMSMVFVKQYRAAAAGARACVALALASALAAGAFAAEGERQSPIDIDKRAVVSARGPTITPFYQPSVTLSVVHTYNPNRVPLIDKEWATLRASYSGAPASFVMVGSQQYDLLQFHFHTPSEHKINGRGQPMEVHFVHLRSGALPCDPEALLVIGALIKEDDEPNRELRKIFGAPNLPTDATQPAVSVPRFNLGKVLPELDDTWRYAGSLTAPSTFTNCSAQGGSIEDQLSADIFPENVQWVVSPRSVKLSARQIEAFRRLFEEGNSRETQALNARVVTRVNDDDD